MSALKVPIMEWKGEWFPFSRVELAIYVGAFVINSVGLVGDSILIWLFSKHRMLRTPRLLMILNITIADMAWVAPELIEQIWNGKRLDYSGGGRCQVQIHQRIAGSSTASRGGWAAHYKLCQAVNGIRLAAILANMSTFALIGFERWYHLVMGKVLHDKHYYAMIAASWLYSTSFSMISLFVGPKGTVLSASRMYCIPPFFDRHSVHRAIGLMTCIHCLSFPAIMMVCYIFIFRKVRRTRQKLITALNRSQTRWGDMVSILEEDQHETKLRLMKKEKSLILSIVVMMGAFTLGWGTYAISTLYQVSTEKESPVWLDIMAMIGIVGCTAINPYLVLFNNRVVREAARTSLGMRHPTSCDMEAQVARANIKIPTSTS
ncbi:uncharacterized protein SPPG_09557 [Spizellomyces punctatus DAOM BR117]|uniref:G-protein coupled receptors family 1 profile domain-containing protein n=1 Tax=Spizellomyces punctatus (strain DAOM BR117) TaxID=645134 RepID=A0A0L0H3E9_SPIPD|nr:uncharacterized protein SPPG_09557 [Spizellomyces punctatus DAOM BR117]KNC95990.1 hypothetical protein SPPG_09557 [Spizellomyces punctatus DAOM BR117]|eukprot:XP_016604030.1 hypothetical protein SPPG_09557 [Spizellomyces punctatus DAOM BR117]